MDAIPTPIQIPEAMPETNPNEGMEPKVHFMDDINYHQWADHLGIDYDTRRDQKIAERMSFLADWAREQTKSEDRIQQQIALKQLVRNLGYQMRGPELVKKLYQWTRLDSRRRQIESQMEAIL